MRTVLIIGGGGYIGTVLTDHFLNIGYRVRSLDLFLYNNNHCILPYLGRDRFDFIYGDLCNPEIIMKSLEGITDVVILAGLVGDPITKKYPSEAKAINEEGIKNTINLLCGKKLNKVIFVSTCSNYGLIEGNQLADEEFELKPLSLYSKAKVAIEKYIISLKGNTDYIPTVLRFATAFGLSPRMRFDLTISEFTRELALGRELLVYDANTWRPYCHVRDFARLISMVIEAPSDKVGFEVFNAGGDINNYTKQKIVDEILFHLPDAKVRYQEHGSDPRNYRVNFNKVREHLGFVPKFSVPDGIQELLSAIRNHIFDGVDTNKNAFGNYEIRYPLLK